VVAGWGLSTLAPRSGSRWAPRAGRGATHVNQDRRRFHVPGDRRPKSIATATERVDGWWEVSHWPRFFDRNQAITALTVTELLESGRDSNDPVVDGAPRGAAMTGQLIRITTALAVAIVAAVAAVISYRHAYELVRAHGETGCDGAARPVHRGRAHPGGKHADPRRQPASASRATSGAVVPGCWHRGHHRCQLGAWPRPRSHWCAGQRLARPGSGRFIRVADDTDQNGDRSQCHTRPLGAGEPPDTGSEPRRTTCADPDTKPATNRTGPGTAPATASAP